MGKLFGTDGIRGIVGENLTVELAFHTGQAIAAVLKEEKGRAPLITIGKDTRISSDMLESALICGICSVGGDVMPFGVLPTPAVAYLTVLKGADAGIVISASHNPFEHNGIKVFNEKGYKLPDATEAKIEEKILSGETIPVATRGEIGVLHHGLKQSKLEYIHHLTTTIDSDLSGLRVLAPTARRAPPRPSCSDASSAMPISSTASRTARTSTTAAAPRTSKASASASWRGSTTWAWPSTATPTAA